MHVSMWGIALIAGHNRYLSWPSNILLPLYMQSRVSSGVLFVAWFPWITMKKCGVPWPDSSQHYDVTYDVNAGLPSVCPQVSPSQKLATLIPNFKRVRDFTEQSPPDPPTLPSYNINYKWNATGSEWSTSNERIVLIIFCPFWLRLRLVNRISPPHVRTLHGYE